MDQVTKLDLEQLATRYHASLVLVFNGDRKTGPHVELYPKIPQMEAHRALILYTHGRARHFAQGCDTRIGTHQTRFRHWPAGNSPAVFPEPPPPDPMDRLVNGFIFGELRYRITCGYRILPDTNQRQEVARFYTADMEALDGHLLAIVSQSRPIRSMELYFEITVFLYADYASAEYENHEQERLNSNVPLEIHADRWYEPKTELPKFTCYDNPFGPFTNFLIIAP